MADQVAAAKPPTSLELIWEHDLVFSGSSGAAKMTLDSASVAGPSPVQALAFALAGCMAMDVVYVLRKGRHDLRGFRADLSAMRAAQEPRRFTSVTLHFSITGAVPVDQIERAIQLSKDKYCSVWHSMRQEIDFDVTYKVTSGV